MEKRKLVLTIIGVVILAMVIMVYIYFSKPGRDEKKNQQTINQVQTVQQKTDEKIQKKIHPEMNWKMLRREAKNTGASSWIMFFILQMKGTFITMYIFRMHMTGQRNYGMAVQSVRTRINRKVKTEKLIETSQRNLSVL